MWREGGASGRGGGTRKGGEGRGVCSHYPLPCPTPQLSGRSSTIRYSHSSGPSAQRPPFPSYRNPTYPSRFSLDVTRSVKPAAIVLSGLNYSPFPPSETPQHFAHHSAGLLGGVGVAYNLRVENTTSAQCLPPPWHQCTVRVCGTDDPQIPDCHGSIRFIFLLFYQTSKEPLPSTRYYSKYLLL